MVAKGEDERKPSPLQAAGTRSVVDSPPCVTTTPLGSPVVPEVYMMSATSSGASGWSGSSSAEEKSSVQPSLPVVTTVDSADRIPSGTSLHRATETSAWRRIRVSSAGPSLGRSGTATAPALWMAR